MEKSLTRYIWTHTRNQQLWILFVVLASMIPYFMAFDLPKQIINGPIQGSGFESADSTQLFMKTEVHIPGFGDVLLFPGIELDRMSTLMALSITFLLLVIVNGLLKFYINTYKGRLGERLLRRIRFELIDKILRFPPSIFKRMKAAEVSSMVKDEVEPMGGFTGDAFVQPALVGGQAIAALTFILLQNFWLGLIAAFMAAIQVGIIPKMRRRLIELGRQRQLGARHLAGRVSEIIDGIGTIHAYDTSNYERADAANQLGHIFKIRYDLYQWKFMVKFINNFLSQLTPFLFYSIGGYLTLKGNLDVGQLVAVINAYKDLPGPLKELIDWDQARQDVQVKYEQVVEQFNAASVLDSSIQALAPEAPAAVLAPLAAVNLSLEDDSGATLLHRVTLKIEHGETVAIVDNAGNGGEALADAFGRVIWPSAGRVTAGERDLLDWPESHSGRQISHVSSETYFFLGSLRDNLLYGLKHAPLVPVTYEGPHLLHRKWAIHEARLAGNPDFDLMSDWIDYSSTTINEGNPQDLTATMLAVLDVVQLSTDVLDLAMRSTFDPLSKARLAEGIVEMRNALGAELAKDGMADYVVRFEPEGYNVEATVGDNLLFGSLSDPSSTIPAIVSTDYFRSVVAQTGLSSILFDMGYTIAENTVEIFGDLPPDHPFFQELSFISADEIPYYQQLLQKLQLGGFETAGNKERRDIIRLSFFYIEPRHRFGVLTPEIMQKIVDTRHIFHEGLPQDLRALIEPYDPERYLAATTLIENILFGKISHRHADASQRIRAVVTKLIRERGMYGDVLEIGLDFSLGAGGKRLTTAQRQKLNLARALMRRSDFYVFNRPLPGLDSRLQEEIVENVLLFLGKNANNPTIIWVLSNVSLCRLFERVIVFDQGTVVQDGTYETLSQESGILNELVST
ncbi:ABC transporter transmembrane domain-containing protein [Sinorhizobium sp. BG8]|uniref:ABC transporter transmembrane domain-containing protein n=1 Tax=Sinorhizobium sp. BG8 TaxID=2613773 RepID=UPI00193DE47F|nr:ABC transporter transmembrane domain-containing protein [Sinorhizobium sp. BG8]QRM53874.1 ABC transporter ATP-binding protein [Sinorhizobium sp. BG8]